MSHHVLNEEGEEQDPTFTMQKMFCKLFCMHDALCSLQLPCSQDPQVSEGI